MVARGRPAPATTGDAPARWPTVVAPRRSATFRHLVVRVPKRLAVVAALSVAASAGLVGPAGPVTALGPSAARAAKGPSRVEQALRRLQLSENRDGGFGAKPGAASDPVTSVWSALAMASLGINPAGQPQTGTTILEYLIGKGDARKDPHWKDLTASTDLAAFVLVTRATGPVAEPASVTAVSKLAERITPGGGVLEQPGDSVASVAATALTTLALVKDPVRSETAKETVAWLKKAFSGGGWGATRGAAARPATTGLALQALWAVEPQEQRLTPQAQTYLGDHANDDGGFGTTGAKTSDPRSTAWVMQGLQATGVDPRTYATGLDNVGPRTYLTKQQQPDGGFGDTLATAQTIPGFNATGYVLDPVAAGSNLASRVATGDRRKNGAKPGGPGGAEEMSGGKANNGGTTPGGSNAPGGSKTPSGNSASPGASDTPGATPSATPTPSPTAAPTPSPAPTPAPTPTPTPTTTTSTTTTPKPTAAAGGKGGEEDPPDAGAQQQVNGLVVGANAAAASTGPSVATGGGDAGDRGAAILGGLIVALVLVGTQLERRRPRRVVS